LIESHFTSWARLVHGSSEAEKGQEFRIGIIYGFGMTGIKMASDCIEGLQELTIGGGYKKLPGMASFLAKATFETAEGIKNFIKSGGFKTAFKGVV